jgi:hypothetical protein
MQMLETLRSISVKSTTRSATRVSSGRVGDVRNSTQGLASLSSHPRNQSVQSPLKTRHFSSHPRHLGPLPNSRNPHRHHISTSTSLTDSDNMPSNPTLAQFFSTNKQWAAKVNSRDPEFFSTSALSQSPKILWFGCADSRVPESVVLAVKPGEVFVHRNIAK